jgi:hypothetical protein
LIQEEQRDEKAAQYEEEVDAQEPGVGTGQAEVEREDRAHREQAQPVQGVVPRVSHRGSAVHGEATNRGNRRNPWNFASALRESHDASPPVLVAILRLARPLLYGGLARAWPATS